jgi:hypothetical protein
MVGREKRIFTNPKCRRLREEENRADNSRGDAHRRFTQDGIDDAASAKTAVYK